MQQRHRMRLDVLGDDELHAREADAVVGQEAGLEGSLGIAELIMILVFGRGSSSQVGTLRPRTGACPRRRGRRRPRRTTPSPRRRSCSSVGGVVGADHRRDAELARHDRGMAGAAAAVGDDGRRASSSPAPSRASVVSATSTSPGRNSARCAALGDHAHRCRCAILLADRAAGDAAPCPCRSER